jgi:hypothetical protein
MPKAQSEVNSHAYLRNVQENLASRRRRRAEKCKMSLHAYVADREAKLAQALAAVADVEWDEASGKMKIIYRDTVKAAQG